MCARCKYTSAVFFLIHKMWTTEKAQLIAMLMLKVNACITCEQHFGHISEKEML